MLIKDFSHGRTVEVPDYSYDLHTVKGREMGRDEIHFLTEASMVIPQLEGEDIKRIHKEYLEYCKREKQDEGKPQVQPFDYNSWQH